MNVKLFFIKIYSRW